MRQWGSEACWYGFTRGALSQSLCGVQVGPIAAGRGYMRAFVLLVPAWFAPERYMFLTRDRLAAVKKSTPNFVQKKLDAMATLLAQEELYHAVSSSRGRSPQGTSGFSAWMTTLSSAKMQQHVETLVKRRLLKRKVGCAWSAKDVSSIHSHS